MPALKHIIDKSGRRSEMPSLKNIAVIIRLISIFFFFCMIKTATHIDVIVDACQIGLDSCGLQ